MQLDLEPSVRSGARCSATSREPPPPGFETSEDALDAFGIDQSDPDRAFAIVDPERVGPRVFFLKVLEGNIREARVA